MIGKIWDEENKTAQALPISYTTMIVILHLKELAQTNTQAEQWYAVNNKLAGVNAFSDSPKGLCSTVSHSTAKIMQSAKQHGGIQSTSQDATMVPDSLRARVSMCKELN